MMSDAIGKVFGLELWREEMLECKPGNFSLIYQGISSNFRKENNLVDRIRTRVEKGDCMK